MRIRKDQIRLSPMHPTLLLNLPHESIFAAPVVVNEEGILIDGYRRFQLCEADELEAIEMKTAAVFDCAYQLNYRTRVWDETDCFFWSRWGEGLGVSGDKLPIPIRTFAEELQSADRKVLELLACRNLSYRQVVAILKTPPAYHEFYFELLCGPVRLNVNETADLLEMSVALKQTLGKKSIKELFESSPFAEILAQKALTPKQRGEALLKAFRLLRYPYYQKKLEQFTSYWQRLDLGQNVAVKKNAFVERGVLEISLSSVSLQDMKESVSKLASSLDSPDWEKIWEE
jgi:hypothetical protein